MWRYAWSLGCVLLCLLIAGPVQATAQRADRIVIDGKSYPLTTEPLEDFIGQKPFLPENTTRTSANWRGYIATWQIQGDQLLLMRVDINLYDKATRQTHQRDMRPVLFPGQTRVVATWYTGALIVPDGEMTQYVHMGYGSTYAHYRIYRISRGRVVETLTLDQKQFAAYRERKFAQFKQSENYRAALAQIRKRGSAMTDDEAEDFLRSYYAETYLSQ